MISFLVGEICGSVCITLVKGVLFFTHFLIIGNTANVLCLSGSVNPNIGVLLSPTSTDITAMNYVTVGDSDNPGYLSIDDLQISASNQGVYTCVMPNELGLVVKLHVGLYPLGYNSKIFLTISECCLLFWYFFEIPSTHQYYRVHNFINQQCIHSSVHNYRIPCCINVLGQGWHYFCQ